MPTEAIVAPDRGARGFIQALPTPPRPAAVPDVERLPQASVGLTERTLFHEPWWLDIATGGRWALARVTEGSRIVGEMPYCRVRAGLWNVSHLPPMTRTLGPVISPLGTDVVHETRHRLSVTSQLIEQLPQVDSFFQVFDPRIDDAIVFALRGFEVSARYTFRLDPVCSMAQAWRAIRAKTRNQIRAASALVNVKPVAEPDEFLRFYEANLALRGRHNSYGSGVMRELVNAFVARNAGRLLGAYDANGRLVAAVALVWDRHTVHYLLSTRTPTAHGGSISLLIWTAIQFAIDQHLVFDLDGFASPASFRFLCAFGGTLKQRLGVERLSVGYSLARTLKRRFAQRVDVTYSPNL
jgi:hypothetical protein